MNRPELHTNETSPVANWIKPELQIISVSASTLGGPSGASDGGGGGSS